MKKYFYLATALVALAACSSSDYAGDDSLMAVNNGETPITFNSGTQALTRADKTGAEAAGDLSNQFIVYAEKNETSGSAPSAGNLVIQNYQVNYDGSTANTTTSNTKDWEYVGYTHTSGYQSHITTSTTDPQTIKYWDYGATNYVFTAVSALPADITAGRVSITKTTSGTTVYHKGYSVTLAKVGENYPSLADLYFSDRNKINAGTGSDRTATNAYGGNATMTFRNTLSHVRVGMYETVPGYAISAISFKVTGDAAAVNASLNPAFGAICPNTKADKFTGTVAVTYYSGSDGGTENHPKMTITPGEGLNKADLILGTNINAITTSSTLATTAASPTYDTDGGSYTAVLPQIANATNMKLKVNYSLFNSVTNEVITVENATAEVPAKYLQWKPNYKYTYLFKISDNTNGHTGGGTDPAGLYPITFDAVEVVAEDGQAEYITTVSEPTITTFGVKDSKYVHDGSEYAATSDIYATFIEGSTVKTPTIGTNVNIYKVATKDATNFPITEASVAEAVATTPVAATMAGDIYTYDGTSTYTKITDASTLVAGTTYYKADASSRVPGAAEYVQTPAVLGTDYTLGSIITYTNINTDATTNFTAAPDKVTTVPSENGKTITIDALKLTGVKAGTYAVEYKASAAWTGTYDKVYKVIVVQ